MKKPSAPVYQETAEDRMRESIETELQSGNFGDESRTHIDMPNLGRLCLAQHKEIEDLKRRLTALEEREWQ